MTQITAKTIEKLDKEEFMQFANAVIDQLHDEEGFDVGDPCMLNICGLDYAPSQVKPYDPSAEGSDYFEYVFNLQHCPTATEIAFLTNRKFVQEFIVNNVLPMIVNKTPVLFWTKED